MRMLTSQQIASLREICFEKIDNPNSNSKDTNSSSIIKPIPIPETVDHPFAAMRTSIKLVMLAHTGKTIQRATMPPHAYFIKHKEIIRLKKIAAEDRSDIILEDENDDEEKIFIPQGKIGPYLINIMTIDYLEHVKTTMTPEEFFKSMRKECSADKAADIFNQMSFSNFCKEYLSDYALIKSHVAKGASRQIVYHVGFSAIEYIDQYYKRLDAQGELQKDRENAKERRLAISMHRLYRLLYTLHGIIMRITGLLDGKQKPAHGYNLNSPSQRTLARHNPLYNAISPEAFIPTSSTTATKNIKIDGNNTDGDITMVADVLKSLAPFLLNNDDMPYYKNQNDFPLAYTQTVTMGNAAFPPSFWGYAEDAETTTQRVIEQLQLFMDLPTLNGTARQNIKTFKDELSAFIIFIHRSRLIFTRVYKEICADHFWQPGDKEYEAIKKTEEPKQKKSDVENKSSSIMVTLSKSSDTSATIIDEKQESDDPIPRIGSAPPSTSADLKHQSQNKTPEGQAPVIQQPTSQISTLLSGFSKFFSRQPTKEDPNIPNNSARPAVPARTDTESPKTPRSPISPRNTQTNK